MKVIRLKSGDNETLQWTATALVSVAGWMGQLVYCEYRGIMLSALPGEHIETVMRRYVRAKTGLDKEIWTRA